MKTGKKIALLICLLLALGAAAAALVIGLRLLAADRTEGMAQCLCILALLICTVIFLVNGLNQEQLLGKVKQELTREDFLDNLEDASFGREDLDEILKNLKRDISSKYGEILARRDYEYSALQSQINPHFLYNTLDSIRSQALVDEFDELAEIVELLSKYCRYSISRKQNFVKLREELENVTNYFRIQQFRFEDRFRLVIDVTDDELYEAEIPKMVLQPLVENALFHGLERKLGQGTVTIKILSDGKDVFAFVSDDGCGMPFELVSRLNYYMGRRELLPANDRKTTGIALPNVNARIKLHYGNRYGVLIYSTEGLGTDVEIVLPLRYAEAPAQQAGGRMP